MVKIEYATHHDIAFWKSLDSHLPESELNLKINEKRCYVIKDAGKSIGVLRYNLFWDLIPFLTLIFFGEPYRHRGFGTQAMIQWETEMRSLGYTLVMTSTMVEETSQHFYRKLGYRDCGCLLKNVPPCDETMEMFMMKQL